MLLSFTFVLATLTSTVLGQTFEPVDFNVTEALLEQGINITELPELAPLAERSSNLACSIACNSLKLLYGSGSVIFEGASTYDQFTSNYWSLQQSNVDPYCIFKPADTAAVSVLVLLSRLTQCPFAAKSGGHAAFTGSSNIDGGITVSFEKLNSITLSSDKKIASIQPGNTWGRVYSTLANSQLIVVGGRVFNIGVGGLTTGGGISFFSSVYGWACDNVESFEVVTASGVVVTASPKQYSDLYWALRGGGNNFGLVVKFNLKTYSLPNNSLWGGTKVYSEDQFPAVLDAFSNLVANSPQDPYAGQWVAWTQNGGLKIAATELYYGKPIANAPIFNEYNSIPAVADTTQVRTLVEYATSNQATNPNGLREVYYGLTVKLDRTLAGEAKDIFYSAIPAVANVPGANPVLIYQGITTGQLQNMAKNGGNPLGLNAGDGPLYLIHVACWWNNQADDAKIYQLISDILTKISEKAKARGKQNDYVYMNYASQFEDVIRSYGADNKAKLKTVAQKYDPAGVYQKLQPGYFKLDRAPVPNAGYFSG